MPPTDTTEESGAELQIDALLNIATDDERDAYFDAQHEQVQLQIRACMNAVAFDYIPEHVNEVEDSAEMSRIAWAQRWGFGFWTMLAPQPAPAEAVPSPNDESISDLAPDEQNAWWARNTFCLDEATSTYAENNPTVQQALDDFEHDVRSDPRSVEALEVWRTCMADAGYRFDDPQAASDAYWNNDELTALYIQFDESQAWDPASPDHTQWQQLVDEEIDIAVTEATCTEHLIEVIHQVRRDLRPTFVAIWQTTDSDGPPDTATD